MSCNCQGPSWSYTYGSWIYSYLCNQCLSPNIANSNPAHGEVYSIQHYMIKFVSDLRQVGGFLWVHRTPVSSTNKTDSHHIIEILLKVALNTCTITITHVIVTLCYSLKRLNVDELYNVFSFLHMVVFSDYHYIEFKSYLLKLKVHPRLNHLPQTNLSKDDTCTYFY